MTTAGSVMQDGGRQVRDVEKRTLKNVEKQGLDKDISWFTSVNKYRLVISFNQL